MPKSDLVRRTDQAQFIRNGEIVTATSVLQISQIAMTSPFSGDFQIVDEGRLIVGESPNLGARFVVSRDGAFGYNAGGMNTFAVYSQGNAQHTGGDIFAGGQNGNYLLYSQNDGTLGLYTPAGAGFIATRDGSLQAGNAAGAHMLWNSASRALEIRNGEDVRISLADTGDASFDGTVYASGGRIYGNMQVDAKLLVGDTDGPGVTIGKFERYNTSNVLVESSEIMATDGENLPWFHVVAGGGTTYGGYFHLGAPGDYAGKMTFDGAELRVADWIVNSHELTAPSGYVSLDTTRGIVFVGAAEEPLQRGATASASAINYMLTFWDVSVDDAWPTHHILAYTNSDTTPDKRILHIEAQPLSGYQSLLRLSSLCDQEAEVEIRAVGGYDLAGQQQTKLKLTAYRGSGTGSPFGYRRIDVDTDVLYLLPTDTAALTGTVPNGALINSDGTYDPGAGAGLYMYIGNEYKPIRLAAGSWELVEYADSPFTAANVNYYPVNTSGGNVAITIPAGTSKPTDWQYTFKKITSDTNTVTISGATIDGAANYVLRNQWQTVTIRRYGANYHVVEEEPGKAFATTASGITLGDGGTTNYSAFDATGHLTFAGTAKPWNDILIEPVARTTGSNAPTFEKWYDDAAGTSRGVYLYSFDDAAGGSEKEVFFNLQMSHAWDGGNIQFHVHWIGAVADTTATPRWGLEYAWKEPGGTYGDTTIVYGTGNHLLEADITANKHYITLFTAIAPGSTADDLSSVLIGRLFRDSANAADTYNATGAKCGLLYMDAHYQLARIGSNDEYSA